MVGPMLTFRTRYESIAKAHTALTNYSSGIERRDEWVYEENKMPIFIDTCVLLNLYEISETERNEFIKFIRKNNNRIFIPSQVQREYNRRRLLKVKGFKDKVSQMKTDVQNTLSKMMTIYKNEKNGLTNLTNRSLIKYGMPQVTAKLKELEMFLNKPEYNEVLQEELKQCSDFISDHIEEECERCWKGADFEYNDPVQAVLTETQLLSSLNDEEQKYIEKLYIDLRKPYDAAKANLSERETITFPGAGDKDKPSEGPIEESVAWGDLYIYHEMLRFMIEHNTDVVFMTLDVAKKDWIKSDHRAYTHYIVNAFEMTGHLMYILDADGVVPTFNAMESKQDDSDNDEISEKPIKQTSSSEITEEKNEQHDKPLIEGQEQTSMGDLSKKFRKIELLSWDRDRSEYRTITEEQLLVELQKTTRWATSYGAGYVGESHFIYNILGYKHYDFSIAKAVLDKLVQDGKVERTSETHDEHSFNCLRLIEKSINSSSL